MPKMNFNFQGYIDGASITEASDVNGETVDVSEMSASELGQKLNAGDLFISLGDYLYESDDAEIEITAFEPKLE